MMTQYDRDYLLTSGGDDRGLFADLEKLLRLAPQWDLKAFVQDGETFSAEVFHDRTEETLTFKGRVLTDGQPPSTPEPEAPDKAASCVRFILEGPAESIDFSVRLEDRGPRGLARFSIHAKPDPAPASLREFDMWARSVANYIQISRSRNPFTRLWKRFLDRWWLTMSQSGKRMALFMVLGEGVALAFFLVILLWWKFSS